MLSDLMSLVIVVNRIIGSLSSDVFKTSDARQPEVRYFPS